MSIDRDKVRDIAFLARIRVEDEALDGLASEISGILDWVEQLGELNTDSVEPMASPVDVTLPLRTDTVSDGNCADKVLANAPDGEDGFYTVPKVVE